MKEIRAQEVKLRSFLCAERITLEEMFGIVAESAYMFRDALKVRLGPVYPLLYIFR